MDYAINILTNIEEYATNAKRNNKYICPCCKKLVQLIEPQKNVKHFKHKHGSNAQYCENYVAHRNQSTENNSLFVHLLKMVIHIGDSSIPKAYIELPIFEINELVYLEYKPEKFSFELNSHIYKCDIMLSKGINRVKIELQEDDYVLKVNNFGVNCNSFKKLSSGANGIHKNGVIFKYYEKDEFVSMQSGNAVQLGQRLLFIISQNYTNNLKFPQTLIIRKENMLGNGYIGFDIQIPYEYHEDIQQWIETLGYRLSYSDISVKFIYPYIKYDSNVKSYVSYEKEAIIYICSELIEEISVHDITKNEMILIGSNMFYLMDLELQNEISINGQYYKILYIQKKNVLVNDVIIEINENLIKIDGNITVETTKIHNITCESNRKPKLVGYSGNRLFKELNNINRAITLFNGSLINELIFSFGNLGVVILSHKKTICFSINTDYELMLIFEKINLSILTSDSKIYNIVATMSKSIELIILIFGEDSTKEYILYLSRIKNILVSKKTLWYIERLNWVLMRRYLL